MRPPGKMKEVIIIIIKVFQYLKQFSREQTAKSHTETVDTLYIVAAAPGFGSFKEAVHQVEFCLSL